MEKSEIQEQDSTKGAPRTKDPVDDGGSDVAGAQGLDPAESEESCGDPGARGSTGDDDNPSSDSWGNWFTKSFESAKVKSNEMYQYLKQDISEFGESIQEAGRDLKDKLKLEDNAKAAVETVGGTVNSLLEQVSSIFGVEPEDDDETSILVGKDGPMIISRIEARIHSIATNEYIFLEDSADSETYEAWIATFDLEKKQAEMTKWLANNPHLQLHYSQLVPDKVSHLLFWHRLYFQAYLITLEEETMAVQDALEAKRDAKRQAVQQRNSESPTGSHESGNDIVHISEEDQKRLLTEYEEEMKRVGPSGSASASAHHSRRSSEQMSSSSSGSFAFVTRDAVTHEAKLE